MLKPGFMDISHHNTIPSSLVPAAQSGIVGAIHKATEGVGYVDDKCESRFFLAQKAGMLWGLYHFIRPGRITDQAAFFVHTAHELEACDDATLWCLDWEDSGVSLNDALTFLRNIKEMTGHDPVVYSGHVLKEALNGKPNSELSTYRLWLAQYASAPTLPPGWSTYWGWQYTDQGTCPGINAPVDLNAYDGTAAELRKDWSGAGDVPIPPRPRPDEPVRVALAITAPEGIDVVVTVNGRAVSA